MGQGDNRKTRKMRRCKNQAKKKKREKAKIDHAKDKKD